VDVVKLFLQRPESLEDDELDAPALQPDEKQESEVVDSYIASFNIAVIGDDDIMLVAKPLSSAHTEVIKQLGMKLELISRENPNDAEYCSALFWPVERKYPNSDQKFETRVLAPKPGRILTKMPWALNLNNREPLSHIRAVALGLERDVSPVPIAREYVQALLRLTRDVSAKPYVEYHKVHLTHKYENISARAIAMMSDRYGWNADMLRDFVRALREIRKLPATMAFQPLDSVEAADVYGETD